MKKVAVVAAAFVALAAAGVAQAQGTGAPAQHQHGEGHGQMGPGGRGGMMMEQMMFKGITLTGAQKAKLDTIHQQFRTAMEAQRGQRPDFSAIREARQKGDTVTANKLMAEQRQKMEAQQQAHFATIRMILTPEQQKQFDANVAEMKQHQGEWGRGRGMRPDTAHKPQR